MSVLSNIVEVGVLPDCNAHRNLPYAVQQIIAQELEVERLKRASMLTGLGISLNTNSEKSSKAAENNKSNKSPNANNETSEKQQTSDKQSGKSKSGKNSSLKEAVSLT